MITENPKPTPQPDPDQETRDVLHRLLRLVAREVVRRLKPVRRDPKRRMN